ncbi:MAG: hypothetical protein IJ562_10405 [Prevotella sp.]|nr:hypothetical protein [Prevotella sp.]
MKRTAVLAVGAAFLLSSCGSYTASGAYTGSTLGSILGSAIGGLNGGPRGSDWGQIVGMAGGAVVGAAIGNAAEKAQQRKIEKYHERVLQKESRQGGYQNYDDSYSPDYGNSGFDANNRGDDRIDFQSGNGSYGETKAPVSAGRYAASRGVDVSKVIFVSENSDSYLHANSRGKIVFEIRNNTGRTIYNVQPVVLESTGNRHVVVSPSVCIESIAAGSGVKYTAMVMTDKKLRNNTVGFDVSVVHGRDGSASSEVIHLDVAVRR